MQSSTPGRRPPPFARQEVDTDALLAVLADVVAIAERERVQAVLIGGIASAVFGRPRWSEDVDLFVRAQDARRLLESLAAAGFDTDETFPDWLFKAFRDGVLVDVIFKSSGDIYLDEEMIARARTVRFHEMEVRVAAPEDIVVMKSIAHSEPTPRYWHDALSVLSRADLDWEYLLDRARAGPRKVLSLLLYAQSTDLPVPDEVIDRLYRSIRRPGVVAEAQAPRGPRVRLVREEASPW